MKLTEENKAEIDALTLSEMLSRWNHSTPKNIWFRGETGEYWRKRMAELSKPSSGNNSFHQYY